MPKSICLSLFLFLVATTAEALTYVTVADEDIVEQADLVLRGTVVDAAVGPLDPVATFYDVEVDRVFKGLHREQRLQVRVPGGVPSDGRSGLLLFGAPRFEPGDRVLLFLVGSGDEPYRILHFQQGAFFERAGRDGRLYARPVYERAELTPPGGPRLLAREAGRFESWIAGRAAGERPAIDYLRPVPPSFEPAFRVFEDEGRVIRWFRFDSKRKRKVRWHRHEDGQRGLADGGKSAFVNALRAWREQSGVRRVRLVPGGLTASTGGFSDSGDGLNTILFEDFNNYIGTPFDCVTGGTLALGGPRFLTSATLEWKGLPAYETREAEIIINTGVAECLELGLGTEEDVEEVYAHELGHTLSLAHTCDEPGTARCTASEVLGQALMTPLAHFDQRGASLGEDDVAGVRMLYDPDFWAAPCDLPPGHPRFCSKCGPCGEGQGNCRRDRQCIDDLVCAKKVGRDFGFRPKTNVCQPPEAL